MSGKERVGMLSGEDLVHARHFCHSEDADYCCAGYGSRFVEGSEGWRRGCGEEKDGFVG